ncbi:hypothetical protein [Scytonema sp. NUACC26]|uniref:hypothetical protein n=1 Tax=Scytonema sp. NUACC26 TaxID=3140176 RepID=UPI0038B2B9D8
MIGNQRPAIASPGSQNFDSGGNSSSSFSTLSAPRRFKSNLFNRRDAEYAEVRRESYYSSFYLNEPHRW